MTNQELFIDQLHKMYKKLDEPVSVNRVMQINIPNVVIEVYHVTLGKPNPQLGNLIIDTWEVISN